MYWKGLIQGYSAHVGSGKWASGIPHSPLNQSWKISLFPHKKGKNHLIINIESGGRGELASCPNSFGWDYLKKEFRECHTAPSNAISPHDSVSSVIQTPRISSKILRCASYFKLPSLCLDNPMKHCLSCLIYYFFLSLSSVPSLVKHRKTFVYAVGFR